MPTVIDSLYDQNQITSKVFAIYMGQLADAEGASSSEEE